MAQLAADKELLRSVLNFHVLPAKLNSMVGEFKTKLARWDNVPESQREQFSQELKKSWDSVNTQYKKVDGMSKKMNPSTGEMNKKTPAPQPAPSSK